MKLISSYAVEIKHINKMFRDTVKIYKDEISFCIKVFEENWDVLETLDVGNKDNKERKTYADSLIHSTKSNIAKYQEFDVKFHKMPTYLRRAVVSAALGHLSSYHSNLNNWKISSTNNKEPSLQIHLNKLPTFYKGNMYLDNCKGDAVKLKLFVNNDWNWVEVKLKHTDAVSIQKHKINAKMSVPTLEKKNKKWFLRFAFEENVTLKNTKGTILAVDLGINTDATCSVMKSDGTILAREFINFASEKDQLYHTLNKIKKVQQKYGSNNVAKLGRYAKFHNEELARKIAKAITDTAVKYNCDVIVFEYLDTKGKKRGSKKQKLQMWKKNSIQRYVEHKAHKNGIRISHICAWNTSKLAYDGTGKVLRGKNANLDTYELCKFSSGKIYNCDLSASYNIGARYFIREIQKIQPVRVWSDIVAKVPECQKRTQCTYNTLLEINRVV